MSHDPFSRTIPETTDPQPPADWREAGCAQAPDSTRITSAAYPYQDGDVTVLGPEIFTDGEVICWRGENFVRQAPSPQG